jgi:hypothetical protein
VAEGDAHRQLVRLLAARIVGEVSHNWSSFIDGAGWDKRAGVPPLLEIYRPDIYAVERGSGRTVIGEAKTADDIDNNHTRQQLAAYFRHLSGGAGGEVWMAVPMLSAGTAHRLCRVVRQQICLTSIRFVVTGWFFGPTAICETSCG